MSTVLKAGSPRKSRKELSIDEVTKLDDAQEIKRLNVNLPAKLMQAYKVQATIDGYKINELTIKLINEYLSKRKDEDLK
jgi:hypothetical protein